MRLKLTADGYPDSRGGDHRLRRLPFISRVLLLFRSCRLAVASFLACFPMMFERPPGTPLRVLCIAAFEYLTRLRGEKADAACRVALAHACDFGAVLNDFYDQGELDRSSYRQLRQALRRLVPEEAIQAYLRALRHVERGRPAFGAEGCFGEPAAIADYRIRVLALSLAWLHAVCRRPVEPRSFGVLVALVGLFQLVDDLLDWKEDWACRRPTYVTAFLPDRRRISQASILSIRLHANRFRSVLVERFKRDPRVAPLTVSGVLVWLAVVALARIRLLDEYVA